MTPAGVGETLTSSLMSTVRLARHFRNATACLTLFAWARTVPDVAEIHPDVASALPAS